MKNLLFADIKNWPILKYPFSFYCFSLSFHSVYFQGIFIDEVDLDRQISQKLMAGDKILAFDDIDYTTMDPKEAYHDACERINIIKTVTISRRHKV